MLDPSMLQILPRIMGVGEMGYVAKLQRAYIYIYIYVWYCLVYLYSLLVALNQTL